VQTGPADGETGRGGVQGVVEGFEKTTTRVLFCSFLVAAKSLRVDVR